MMIPAAQSYLGWMMRALGPFYAVAIPSAGLAVLALAAWVLLRSRRASAVAACLPLVPLPLFLGVYGAVDGTTQSAAVMAAGTLPTPPVTAIADGVGASLILIEVGMMSCLPAYAVVCIGLVVRSLRPVETNA